LSTALDEHFRPSRMEVQNRAGGGGVLQKGTVLALQADAVPANKLRVVQINTKSPRFHMPDYAPVDVGSDGRLTASPGPSTLAKSTEERRGQTGLLGQRASQVREERLLELRRGAQPHLGEQDIARVEPMVDRARGRTQVARDRVDRGSSWAVRGNQSARRCEDLFLPELGRSWHGYRI